MANELSAAAIDLDAVFTAPPDLQKQMLIETLRPKIHAVQPQLVDECLKRFLETDIDYLVNLALDEPSLNRVIVKIKAEIDDAARTLGIHVKEKNSESRKEGATSSKGSTSLQRDVSPKESDVPETLCGSQLEKRIREIFMLDPWTQTQYEEDPETQYDPFSGVCCVCISNFFMDATNLVYYIRGTRNVAMFYSGMAGMQAFNGAALFAITHSSLETVTQPIWPRPQDNQRPKRLTKSKSPIEANKWRYMYETGRILWRKSGIDLEKLGQAMEKSNGGESSRSKGDHASDSQINIDPEKPQTQQRRESAASERGYGKKIPVLRGGAARSDSIFDTQSPRRSKRKKARNPDYKSLHNGLDPWQQAEKSSTQTSREVAAEVRSNQLQRQRSPPSFTSGPPKVHPPRVPEVLLDVSSNGPNPIYDDQDVLATEYGPSRDRNPLNSTNYGASAEWQSNIEQSCQAAQADDQRLMRVTDALYRGQITVAQASKLLGSVQDGLRYQASGRLMLVLEDTRAAEVLGNMTTNRESGGLSNATASNAQPLETMPGILEADSNSWLSAALDRERDFEGELEQ